MLMEILCVDMKQAYELFIQSGRNIQNAIQRKTNPQPFRPMFSVAQGVSNRTNLRNGSHNTYRHEIGNFNNSFNYDEDEDDDDYPSLPVARRRPNVPIQVDQESDFDVKFNKLLQFRRKKKDFTKKYKIRRQCTEESQSISMKIFENKTKKNQGRKILQLDPYIKQIEKQLIQKRCYIKFGKGSMSETLQSSYKTSQPFILYHLALDYDLGEIDKKIEKKQKQIKKGTRNKKMVIDITEDKSQEKLVEQQERQTPKNGGISFLKSKKNSFLSRLLLDSELTMISNQAFLNYIFDSQNHDYETYFKEYFPNNRRNQSYLTVLRVNILDQIGLVGQVKLDQVIQRLEQGSQGDFEEGVKQVGEKLKLLRQRVTTQQTQQRHLEQRYKLLQQGVVHYDYIKPPTTSQKIKIKEDREIIRQQQEQFMNMQNQIMQQQVNQVLKEQVEINNNFTKEEMLQKRRQIRQRLTKYAQSQPDVMFIKFRLPSGKNIILNVSSKQKIAYLFDYIYSLQAQNIGFEEQEDMGFFQRVFDIIRPEDRTSLQSEIQNSLEEVFSGSVMEALIIKQK